jgi:hypothetical protein
MSKIFSNIYKILSNKFDDFKDIIIKNFNNFDIFLINLENNNENNINMDYYKSYFLFYSNCYNYEIIEFDIIIKILLNYQTKLLDLINKSNNKEICENINELIFIFIKNSYTELIKNLSNDKNKLIFQNINNISNYKTYNYESLSNKVIFKNKDLMDLINKY